MLKDGFFYGWDSYRAVLVFATMVGKDWFSGMVAKNLGSLTRQLCSITSVGILYFVLPIRYGADPPYSMSFICTFLYMMVVVIVVLFTFSQYDLRRNTELKSEMNKCQYY